MSQIARGPLASTVRFFIEEPRGNYQLRQVKTVSYTDNSSGEIVIGGNGPLGKTFIKAGTTVSLEVHRVAGVPNETDWHALKKAHTEFVLSMQDGAGDTLGTRYTLNDCTVTKIDMTGGNDGNQTMTIEVIAATDMQTVQPEPAQ